MLRFKKGKWARRELAALVRALRAFNITRQQVSRKKNITWAPFTKYVPTRSPAQCKSRLQKLRVSFDKLVARLLACAEGRDSIEDLDIPDYMHDLLDFWLPTTLSTIDVRVAGPASSAEGVDGCTFTLGSGSSDAASHHDNLSEVDLSEVDLSDLDPLAEDFSDVADDDEGIHDSQ